MSRLCRLKSYKNIGDDGKWAYSEIMQLRRQLAESQAREARLREALSELADLMEDVYTGYYHPDSFTNETAREALALPHDDTALKEYIEKAISHPSKDV